MTVTTQQQQDFISKIAKLAVIEMMERGLPASVIIAQAILESGYGTTDLAKYARNLFGMKCILSGNTWETVWDCIYR